MILSLNAACASSHARLVRAPIQRMTRPVVHAPVVIREPTIVAPREVEAPTGLAALPGWVADQTHEVLPAWRRSCARLLRKPPDSSIGPNGLGGTAADWQPACRAIPEATADATEVRAYFARWFAPLPVVSADGNANGLFTGYFEPELHGSRTRSRRYAVPLYGRPPDLHTLAGQAGVGRRVRGRLRPYWTRAQIVAGALRRRATPLLWVDNAIDAFFLEIQGSGRVILDDGTTLQVNYAASNGRPYVPIGRVLIERRALQRGAVSLQSIREWLSQHPREAQAVMNQNPSYVFFRLSDTGATGAEGVVLTPGRSLAVDTHFIPLGAPLFLDLASLAGVGVIQRLVIAQDTGGAIRGEVRGDLFWGAGPDAYDRAGRMAQGGRYWMLVPIAVGQRRAASAEAARASAAQSP